MTFKRSVCLATFAATLFSSTPALSQEAEICTDDHVAIMSTANKLFDAIEFHDPDIIRPYLLEGGQMMIAMTALDGSEEIRRSSFAEWMEQLPGLPEGARETMSNARVLIDANMAAVWGDYVFYMGDDISHCGTNHLSLVRDDGVWKVAHTAFTFRRSDCEG